MSIHTVYEFPFTPKNLNIFSSYRKISSKNGVVTNNRVKASKGAKIRFMMLLRRISSKIVLIPINHVKTSKA